MIAVRAEAQSKSSLPSFPTGRSWKPMVWFELAKTTRARLAPRGFVDVVEAAQVGADDGLEGLLGGVPPKCRMVEQPSAWRTTATRLVRSARTKRARGGSGVGEGRDVGQASV